MVYLNFSAIGQSDMTRDYIYSLTETPYKMPRGPVLLQVESLLGALQTEVGFCELQQKLLVSTTACVYVDAWLDK